MNLPGRFSAGAVEFFDITHEDAIVAFHPLPPFYKKKTGPIRAGPRFQFYISMRAAPALLLQFRYYY